jgi:hypothetical protein
MSFDPEPTVYAHEQHIDLTSGKVYRYLVLRKAPPPMLRDDHLRTPPSPPRVEKRKVCRWPSSQPKRQRSLPKSAYPLNEEEESDYSPTVAAYPLNEEEESDLNEEEESDSDCSSTAATAGVPAKKKCHSGGSTTSSRCSSTAATAEAVKECHRGSTRSSLPVDDSTGFADSRPEQVFVRRELASWYMSSPLALPPKGKKLPVSRAVKKPSSTGTMLGMLPSAIDHQSATGGPGPIHPMPTFASNASLPQQLFPQQQLPDHYVATGCVESHQERKRRQAGREYNARRYYAKKLAIAKLKSTDNESASGSRAMLGKLPSQVASSINEPGATQKGKQAVLISRVQREDPLASNISPLPLPEVKKVRKVTPFGFLLSPLPLPPKVKKAKLLAVPLPSNTSPLPLPP